MFRKRSLLINSCGGSLALALLLWLAFAQQPQPSKPDFGELEKVALAELAETKAPGAAVGVVSGDRLVFAKGFGVSNVETGAPVTPDMLFRLGSTTKMFTAAALALLAEEGKLKLDEPIGKYAKGLSPKIAGLTAHQLLSHTAGLKDGAQMYGRHDDEALADTVRALKDDFLFTTPGRIWSYSNAGYWLAGYLIEVVSGKPYADALDERLFKPVGMQRTTLRPTMAMTWPLAQGHDVSGREKPKVVRPFADNAGNWPAGSIFSSVNDLSRFVIAFMNGGQIEGKQVLSPSLIKQLSSPHADQPGSEWKYGYGLGLGKNRGVRMVEHNGARSGYGSIIRMVPDHRFAVIILVNRTGGSLSKTAEKAMELMLPLEAKVESKPKPIAMTEAEMARYVGVYDAEPDRIEIVIKDGKLLFKGLGLEAQVIKLGESRFSAMPPGDTQKVEFALIPGADGKAEFLFLGGRAHSKVQSQP
ncbi:MAG TPA: serine hydrolase domain-containing protein [Blastocatellia bacterium]|jgi:CubicO group peptidase (beta-lactamase class C family)|nr:serine hydrolase domain-containing protein [Blastocatellia bacterium]